MQDLCNPAVIREVLGRHGFTFSKALGQNFLINGSVCPRMAQASGASPQTGVLEIGPGMGVLTAQLALRAGKVVAVELDQRLRPVLAETLGEFPNVKVVWGDVLKLDLHRLVEEEFGGMPVSVCANLPYYITSPVIMSLLEQRLPLTSLTVMVQKEAAARIAAPPGSRQCGAISAAIHYYSKPKVLFQVSRGSFLPPPQVDSAVIQLELHQTPPVKVESEPLFFYTVKGAFSMRRKTLLNCLAPWFGLPKEELGSYIAQAGLSPALRAEQLKLQDFAALANTLWRQGVSCPGGQGNSPLTSL